MFVGLVTTRSVKLVMETLRVSRSDVQGVSAVTSAGVVVTPDLRSSSCRCRMISLATASVRSHRLTMAAPVNARARGTVWSCPQPFRVGRVVESPKCQKSVRGAVPSSAVPSAA